MAQQHFPLVLTHVPVLFCSSTMTLQRCDLYSGMHTWTCSLFSQISRALYLQIIEPYIQKPLVVVCYFVLLCFLCTHNAHTHTHTHTMLSHTQCSLTHTHTHNAHAHLPLPTPALLILSAYHNTPTHPHPEVVQPGSSAPLQGLLVRGDLTGDSVISRQASH